MAELPSVETITNDIRASAVDEVAVSLKQFYKVFDPKGKIPEDDQAFKDMATSLVKDGKFNATSGKEVSREDAIADLEKIAKDNPDLKKSIQDKIENLKEIPEDDTVNKVGASIHKGIEKSTSFFSSFEGFFESIMNYIMGFIDWMVNGSKDGKSLMQHIGERFAATTSDFVKEELEAQRMSDPKVAALLTPERIQQIGGRVEGQVVGTFTGERPTEATNTKLANTKTEESPIQGIVINTIDAQIAQQFKEDNTATRTVDETGPARAALTKSGVSSIDAVKNAFQNTMHDVVKNEANATKTHDELREIIADGVTAKLDWDKQNKSWNPFNAASWAYDQGGETLLKEAIVKGADGKSMVDDATLKKLKDATKLYHQGVGGKQPSEPVDPRSGPSQPTPSGTQVTTASPRR